jgi:hypothetical protein
MHLVANTTVKAEIDAIGVASKQVMRVGVITVSTAAILPVLS